MELQDQPGTSSPATDVIAAAPWSDHDPYTDEALLDPWPGYKQMHDAGPAVWLQLPFMQNLYEQNRTVISGRLHDRDG